MSYRIDFAPDDQHWQTIKKGRLNKLWDDFVFNSEYRILMAYTPANFRLVNSETGQVIGELREKQQNQALAQKLGVLEGQGKENFSPADH